MSQSPSVIAVASGKGGVGKSTLAVNLSVTLAQRGHSVGLLDTDVYGPNVPSLLGVTRRAERQRWLLSTSGEQPRVPTLERYGVQVASIGLMFGERQPISWYAGLVEVLVGQLTRAMDDFQLDWLVLDMPPGTADVSQAVIREFPDARALVVVTPADTAHLDAHKLVTMLRDCNVTILGGIENMARFDCPSCGHSARLFGSDGGTRPIWSAGIEKLLELPVVSDPPPLGVPLVVHAPTSPYGLALSRLASLLEARTGTGTSDTSPS